MHNRNGWGVFSLIYLAFTGGQIGMYAASVLLVFILPFSVFLGVQAAQDVAFYSKAVVTQGVIQNIRSDHGLGNGCGRSGQAYITEVRFQLPEQVSISFDDMTNCRRSYEEIGGSVAVLYLPQDPAHARIQQNFYYRWSDLIFFGIFFTLSIALFISLVVSARKELRRRL